MRARNIKPGFFKNEQLVVLPVQARLLFAGLWCMADREGRLQDRPAKLKMELFPADNFDMEPLLAGLSSQGLIQRYQVNGARYIQVIEFAKHQHPHHKEPPSTIPKPEASPSPEPDKPQAGPSDSLIPDSLIAESSPPESRTAAAPPAMGVENAADVPRPTNPLGGLLVARGALDPWMLEFKAIYPPRSGDPNWRGAWRAGRARIAEGHTPDEFLAGARRYAEFCLVTGKLGQETVQQASRFLGPGKPFQLPWTPPPTKAQLSQNANVTASVEWLRRQEAVDAAQ